MRAAFTVFKKELIDTLRDRRTIIAMVVVPLVLFPLLFVASTWIMQSQSEQAAQRTLRVALVHGAQADGLAERLAAAPQVDVVTRLAPDSARARVRREVLDAAFIVAPSFQDAVQNLRAGAIEFVYKSGDNTDILRRRLQQVLDGYERQLLEERFSTLQLSLDATEAVQVRDVDVATAQEKIARSIGGFLPYVFILFCFLGSMYPAIDLGAGEKERGTLEALLSTPASRPQILLGKLGTIVLTGVASAVIAIGSVVISPMLVDDVPQSLLDAAYDILDPGVMAALLTMLVPLTLFFGAAQLSLSFYAKSFKEAQSIINPLTIVVIFPVFIGLLPGIELDAVTALVPVLNVSLATKGVIAGDIALGMLALVYGSLAVWAALGLGVCAYLFRQENIIFRT
ncbi:ABC transporter permease [Salisaeta longa]|uniref:ABC transporter permease n=1 Tax=Salisaeta longa TaxID=503170 RepID=UPI0003B301EE|nr:ABC transporter permease [Salisaeta longa]